MTTSFIIKDSTHAGKQWVSFIVFWTTKVAARLKSSWREQKGILASDTLNFSDLPGNVAIAVVTMISHPQSSSNSNESEWLRNGMWRWGMFICSQSVRSGWVPQKKCKGTRVTRSHIFESLRLVWWGVRMSQGRVLWQPTPERQKRDFLGGGTFPSYFPWKMGKLKNKRESFYVVFSYSEC